MMKSRLLPRVVVGLTLVALLLTLVPTAMPALASNGTSIQPSEQVSALAPAATCPLKLMSSAIQPRMGSAVWLGRAIAFSE